VTIPADPPLPTLAIDSVTVTDKAAGTATLTITRTGAVYAPSTVTYKTVGGSAATDRTLPAAPAR